jgi:hypothetical protein
MVMTFTAAAVDRIRSVIAAAESSSHSAVTMMSGVAVLLAWVEAGALGAVATEGCHWPG